jgi:diguanylate cyclase (GGDEF)-like protein
MPSTIGNRAALLSFAAALFGVALFALLSLDVPSLGIAYLLFLPVALVGLATSPLFGAVAGIAAGELYAVGVIFNADRPGEEVFSTTSGLRLLIYATIGALVGKSAADHRDLTQRLRMLAERDPLTGLLNARAYEAALAGRLGAGRPFALVLVDLDGLNEINDTLGHLAGNESLKSLARALSGAVRGSDDVARIGGDEFAVVVDGVGAPDAGPLCDRLKEALSTRGILASLGWAAFPEDGSDARSLFSHADRRLSERRSAERPPGRPAVRASGREAVPAEPLG